MRAAKRLWIYSGLGVPEGIALVRRPLRRRTTKRILLVGNPKMRGIVPPLSSLVTDHNGVMSTDLRDATLRQWAENDWLDSHLRVFRPSSVLIGLDPRDRLARWVLSRRIRRYGARDIWLVPPKVPWAATSRFLPAPVLNVKGFALWAAKAFDVIK